MAKKKVTQKEAIREAKAELESSEKENFTFRFNSDLLKKFDEICKREGISRTFMIEKLIKDFIES